VGKKGPRKVQEAFFTAYPHREAPLSLLR